MEKTEDQVKKKKYSRRKIFWIFFLTCAVLIGGVIYFGYALLELYNRIFNPPVEIVINPHAPHNPPHEVGGVKHVRFDHFHHTNW